MSTFQSGRSFGKAVLSTLLSLLAACGGGGGGSASNNNNTGGSGNGGGTPPPAPTGIRLTLTGTVTDAPIPGAVVTATIGSQTFTATADANGNYRLELSVAENATDGFVTLTAKGAGAQSHVELSSLLGTFQSLKTQAGSDEVLSSSENFATRITNVSTALAVLLQQANGGQPVASQTLIDALAPTLNAQQLLDVAAAIKLLVDVPEDYPMPAGQTSLQALLSNATAREQLVADFFEQDPATFQQTQTAIVNDPALTQPLTSATLPSTLTAVLLADDETTYYGFDRAVSYTFNTDGTGKASSGTWQRNMTWSISGASVEIVYETPVTWLSAWERKICPEYLMSGYANYGYADYPIDYDVAGAKLTLLNGHTLAITENRQITDRACSPAPATEVATVARAIQDADDFQTIDPAELRDSIRTLWVYDLPIGPGYSSFGIVPDLARLHADGTGATDAYGKDFTWSLDSSGRILSVAFEDGVTAKFRWLREIDEFTTEVLFEFTLPSGERYVDAGVSLQTDLRPQLAFTSANSIGRHYRYGVDDPPLNPGAKGSRWRFDADGFGSQERERIDESGNLAIVDGSNLRPQWGYSWRIDGNDVIQVYTETDPPADSGIERTFNCELGIDPYCIVSQELRIVPLAREGNRTFALESWRYGQPNVYEEFSIFNSIVYFDYEPFGATAVVTRKPSRARAVAPTMRRDSHIARGPYHNSRN